MATSKKSHVRGMLTRLSSSRLNYKPYNYELCFDGGVESKVILVELDIPSDTIIESTEDAIVINLDGLNAMLKVTADSIDKLQREYEKEIIK